MKLKMDDTEGGKKMAIEGNGLKGKVAIVTGGAGGIGKGVTRAFGKEGVKVLATDINEKSLKKAKTEFDKLGIDVTTTICDGSDESQVKAAVKQTVDTYGRIDFVVNNAHGSTQKPFIELTKEDMDLSLYTGLWATFYFMQQAYPYVKENKGAFINFGSSAGIQGHIYQASYAAAKEGIRALSRVAAREWGRFGIRVNVLCPFALTPGVEEWKKAFPKEYEQSISAVPLKRIGDPESDIGRVVVFLCSEDANFITGQTIQVEGGGDMRP